MTHCIHAINRLAGVDLLDCFADRGSQGVYAGPASHYEKSPRRQIGLGLAQVDLGYCRRSQILMFYVSDNAGNFVRLVMSPEPMADRILGGKELLYECLIDNRNEW